MRSVQLSPSFGSVSRISKDRRDVRAQFCPSGRQTSTEGFREESWSLGVCMKWRAAAALLTARIAVRTKGKVLWVVTRPDPFAPAIAQARVCARPSDPC